MRQNDQNNSKRTKMVKTKKKHCPKLTEIDQNLPKWARIAQNGQKLHKVAKIEMYWPKWTKTDQMGQK